MSTLVKIVLDVARDHNRGVVRDPVEQESSQSPLDQNGNAGEKVGCCLPFIFPGVPSKGSPNFLDLPDGNAMEAPQRLGNDGDESNALAAAKLPCPPHFPLVGH